MTPAEQEQVRADIAEHGVRQPLMLYPDEADKTARGKPKLKVLDGRHRLQFASSLGKPVRVEVFEGTEQEARAVGLVAEPLGDTSDRRSSEHYLSAESVRAAPARGGGSNRQQKWAASEGNK